MGGLKMVGYLALVAKVDVEARLGWRALGGREGGVRLGVGAGGRRRHATLHGAAAAALR